MAHANCKDQNINQWIELEVKRFVQKPTNDADALRHRIPGFPAASVPGSRCQVAQARIPSTYSMDPKTLRRSLN